MGGGHGELCPCSAASERSPSTQHSPPSLGPHVGSIPQLHQRCPASRLTVVRVCLHCERHPEAIDASAAAAARAPAQREGLRGGRPKHEHCSLAKGCCRCTSTGLQPAATAMHLTQALGVPSCQPPHSRNAGEGPRRRVGRVVALAHAERWALGGGVAARGQGELGGGAPCRAILQPCPAEPPAAQRHARDERCTRVSACCLCVAWRLA